MSVAFPCLNVKIVGTHAGISIGEDGPSQMGIEDVSLACSLPNFTVVVPADEPSMTQAVHALTRFLRLASSLATALGQVHRHGMIHKYIKPANVFVDDDGM